MKRIVSVLLMLALVASCLVGCEREGGVSWTRKTEDVILETEMNMYDVFFQQDLQVHETVSFTLYGELPEQEPDNGDFDGRIQITDEAGNTYTYRDMEYSWKEGKLILEYEESGVKYDTKRFSCLYDPEEPEQVLFLDQNWGLGYRDETLLVYLYNDLTEYESLAVGTQLGEFEQIDSVEFVSAQEAYDEFMEDVEDKDAFASIEPGDVRARYQVTVKAGEDLEDMIRRLEAMDAVESVRVVTLQSVRIFAVSATAEDLKTRLDAIGYLESQDKEIQQETQKPTVDPAKGYDSLIQEYKQIVEYRLAPENVDGFHMELSDQLTEMIESQEGMDYRWGCMVAEMKWHAQETLTLAHYGYVLMDLNRDDVPELIWCNADRTLVFAIFTLYNGAPVLLDCYWSRYTGVIQDNDLIYTLGSGGAAYYEFMTYQIDPGAVMVLVEGYRRDDDSYYQFLADQFQEIDKEHFEALTENYPRESGMHFKQQPLTTLQ